MSLPSCPAVSAGERRSMVRRGLGAVVLAAGYETGPGNLDWVGGTPEEAHHYLGTTHGDTMTLGFAMDSTLPLGPVECIE